MYKCICIFTLFLLTNVVFAVENGNNIEFVGVVSKRVANVYSKPDTSSRVIRRISRGNKVIVTSNIDEQWYKIKVNNVTEGFIKKEDITFENTLSKEAARTPYELKKADLDIKAIVERFNIHFNESVYYQKVGIVPQIEYMKMFNSNNTLNVDIVYTMKSQFESSNTSGVKNPFEKEMLNFMEVIFFKSFIVSAEVYRINIYKYVDEKPQLYAFLEYKFDEDNFNLIKNRKGKIFEYVKSDVPLHEIFQNFP